MILIAADKGLCAALNTNVFRLAAQFDPASTVFITAGRKAAQFVARSGRRLIAEFAYADSPTFPEARAIAAFARDLFLKGEVDEVRIVTTRFVNTLTQEPVIMEYLPVGAIKGLKIPGVESEEELTAETGETLFEPSPEALLAYLLGHYLNIYVYYLLLSAKASEQSARMVSMMFPTGRYSRDTGSCVSVLTKRVAMTTSSTSPLRKRSRAYEAIALASENVGESP